MARSAPSPFHSLAWPSAARWLLASILVPAVGLMLSACGGGGSGEAPETFIFARGSDAERLDPADVDDGESVDTMMPVFEGLVRFRPGTLEVEPWLAESYSISNDGLVYTFRIRPGIRFHDGVPLDAETAAFSFRRQMDPGHPAHFESASFPYWRDFYSMIETVDTPEPMTLRLRLSEPNAPLLRSLAAFPVWLVSPGSFEAFGERMARHPVGTGPYRFVEWRPNEAVILERNADYWGPFEPGFERLVLRVIPDNTSRLLELRSGSVHGINGIQPAEAQSLSRDPRFTVYREPGMNVGYLAMSALSPKMQAVELRRAIALAIDKEAVVRLALDGHGAVANYPLPPGLPGYPDEGGEVPLRHDPEAARAILEAHPELTGQTLTLATTSAPRPYFPDPVRVASLVRSDLEAIGLKVRIETREWNSHLERVRRGDFDLGLLGWNGDNGDTDNFLGIFFGSWAAEVGAATNIAFYQNPQMDALLVEARETVDEAERARLYREALALWERDIPLVPLVHGDQIVALRSEVTNFTLLKNSNLDLGPVGWKTPQKGNPAAGSAE